MAMMIDEFKRPPDLGLADGFVGVGHTLAREPVLFVVKVEKESDSGNDKEADANKGKGLR